MGIGPKQLNQLAASVSRSMPHKRSRCTKTALFNGISSLTAKRCNTHLFVLTLGVRTQTRLDKDLLFSLPGLHFNITILRCRHWKGLDWITSASLGEVSLSMILWFHIPILFLCVLLSLTVSWEVKKINKFLAHLSEEYTEKIRFYINRPK